MSTFWVYTCTKFSILRGSLTGVQVVTLTVYTYKPKPMELKMKSTKLMKLLNFMIGVRTVSTLVIIIYF